MGDTSTVPVSKTTASKIKKLAEQRSKKLGLPRPLSQKDFVEMLVNEEEERTENA